MFSALFVALVAGTTLNAAQPKQAMRATPGVPAVPGAVTVNAGAHLWPRRVMALPANGAAGDWQELGGGGIAGGPWNPCIGELIYDAAQVDHLSGTPIGGECVVGGSAGTRFIETPYQATSITIEDFRVTPGADLAIGGGVVLLYWDPPAPAPIYLVVYFYDDFSFDCTLEPCPMFGAPWPARNLMWGAMFDFDDVPASADYYVLHFDFCNLDSHPAPADGQGAITLMVASDVEVHQTPPFLTYALADHPAEAGLDPTRPSPMFLHWGFRDDGTPYNWLQRPGQPDVAHDPDENRAWTNTVEPAAEAPNIWQVQECRQLAPLNAPYCQLVSDESAVSLWAMQAGLGACCLPNAVCIMATQVDCQAQGGLWRGMGSSCPEACAGACVGQIRGDTNCNGRVDNFDIECFVYALTQGEAGWNASCGHGVCGYRCVADINGDGLVNMFDIDPFALCMANYGCQ